MKINMKTYENHMKTWGNHMKTLENRMKTYVVDGNAVAGGLT